MTNQTESIAAVLPSVPKAEYSDKYYDHLLEQYKLYLTLTDKISDRRSAANTFFLTLNTGLISAIGITSFLSSKGETANSAKAGEMNLLFILAGFAMIVLCYSWYRLIRSYRDLNSAKFKVVHEIEKLLPIKPYDAEWEAVGRGNNKKLYFPFTHIEIYVPWIFMALHIALVIFGIFKDRIR
jgi:hypothetical protein